MNAPSTGAVGRFLEHAAGADPDELLRASGWAAADVAAALPALVAELARDDPDPVAMDLCGRSCFTVGDLATGVFRNRATRPLLAAAVPLLVPLLATAPAAHRHRVAEALRGVGPAAHPALMAAYPRAGADERLAILSAFRYHVADGPALVAFAAGGLTDPDPRVRLQAVENLFHSPSARAALAACLADADAGVRNRAAEAVRDIDRRRSEPPHG